MARRKLKPVWICPKCGARLVSKNLWHSCGRFTLEALFDYGSRWQGHFVRIQKPTDLDDDLRTWLKESHDVVGMQSDMGLPAE